MTRHEQENQIIETSKKDQRYIVWMYILAVVVIVGIFVVLLSVDIRHFATYISLLIIAIAFASNLAVRRILAVRKRERDTLDRLESGQGASRFNLDDRTTGA